MLLLPFTKGTHNSVVARKPVSVMAINCTRLMQLRVKIVLFSSSQINVSIKLKDVDGLNEMKTS